MPLLSPPRPRAPLSAPPRPRARPRSRARVAAAGCALLLTATATACGATQKLTTGLRVRAAVQKLGEQPAASFITSVDGSTDDAYAFLRRTRGESATRAEASRLARAELTFAVGSGEENTPLQDVPRSDAFDLAAALNFGGKDVVAVKSVQEKVYVKLKLTDLARETHGSPVSRRTARRITGLADDLPDSLRSARDALRGTWVRVDPAAFDDFAQAAERLAGKAQQRAGGEDPAAGSVRKRSEEFLEAAAIGSALDGQSQREFVHGVERLLGEHASFTETGHRDGADHVRLTLPGREAAGDLTAALAPLGIDVDPARVPDRTITADLALRRGQLTTLTLDVGQFTGGGAHLPLRLDFGGGDAVPVGAPGGAKKLHPQDLLAAIVYGALGTRNL